MGDMWLLGVDAVRISVARGGFGIDPTETTPMGERIR